MRRDYSWLWLALFALVATIGYVTEISIPPIVFLGGFVIVMLIYMSLSLERLHRKIDRAAERDAPHR